MMNSRRLTVSYQTPNTYHREWPHRPLPSKPFLRLHGRWLDEAGFAIGAQVCVQVMPGRLVLEVIEPERTVEPDVKYARRSSVD
jgi:Toxin SymE, type I toxin-antitoxin system